MSEEVKFVYQDNTLQSFVSFMVQANRADKNNAIVQMNGKDHIVEFADMKETSDRRGKLFRSQSQIENNNNARTLMYNAVVSFFGDEKKIPESVKKAMLLDKFGLVEKSVDGVTRKEATSGKPLRACRVKKIFNALRQVALENPRMYAQNFISLMLAIPKKSKWDVKYQNEQMMKQANLFFDKMFPADVFNKVNLSKYIEIVHPEEGAAVPDNPGEELKARLKDKLNEAIDAYIMGRKDWTQKLSDVLYTGCMLLEGEQAERCTAVAKEIGTYYTKQPVNPAPSREYEVKPAQKESSQRENMSALNKAIAKVLSGEDKEGIDPNAEVVTTAAYQDEIDAGKINLCKSNPFQFAVGKNTPAIAKAIAEEMRRNGEDVTPESILIQIASDRRMCCGGFLHNYTSQEEDVVRNMDPKTLAPLAKYVELNKKGTEFIYKPGGLDNTKGFLLQSKVARTYSEKIDEPFDVQLLYDSMPSFSNVSSNFDSHGTLAWMLKSLKLNSGMEITEKQEQNALKIIEKLQDNCKKGQYDSVFQKGAIFKELMMILTFAGQNDKFDIFGSNAGAQADKLFRLIESGDYQKLLDKAEANYEKTVSEMMKGWVIMARERGTKYFLGTAIGGAAFANDSNVVARLMAETFLKYGGDMKYVFCQYRSPSERITYENAFREAYQRLNRNTNVFTQQPEEELSPLLQDEVEYHEEGIKIPDAQIRNAPPNKLSLDFIKTAPKKWATKILSGLKKIAIGKQDIQARRKSAEEYLKEIFELLFGERVKKNKSVAEYLDHINTQMVSKDFRSALDELVSQNNPDAMQRLESLKDGRDQARTSEEIGQIYLETLAASFANVENEENTKAFNAGVNALKDVLERALKDIAEDNNITLEDIAIATAELQMDVDDIEIPEEELQQEEEQNNVNNQVDADSQGPQTIVNENGEEEIPRARANNQ